LSPGVHGFFARRNNEQDLRLLPVFQAETGVGGFDVAA
jgi:hypothetical protein